MKDEMVPIRKSDLVFIMELLDHVYREDPSYAKDMEMMDQIKQRTIRAESPIGKDETELLHQNIHKILINLGVRPGIRGHKYLIHAVEIAYNDPLAIRSMTKHIYPKVADRFNTSASCVERSIRHAIEIAFNNPVGEKFKHSIFGNTIYGKGKPTNSHFIAAVADGLRNIYPSA